MEYDTIFRRLKENLEKAETATDRSLRLCEEAERIQRELEGYDAESAARFRIDLGLRQEGFRRIALQHRIGQARWETRAVGYINMKDNAPLLFVSRCRLLNRTVHVEQSRFSSTDPSYVWMLLRREMVKWSLPLPA